MDFGKRHLFGGAFFILAGGNNRGYLGQAAIPKGIGRLLKADEGLGAPAGRKIARAQLTFWGGFGVAWGWIFVAGQGVRRCRGKWPRRECVKGRGGLRV